MIAFTTVNLGHSLKIIPLIRVYLSTKLVQLFVFKITSRSQFKHFEVFLL